ncbi:hypothetical protein BASA50_009847 [Batrachochytrium salamandrivorans]|uniref:CH-like domain-containing protein n=1 Tax=Batrachochytrium salamandrivorans TaxID=1357716 RepID=A0ABQ8F0N0_9FUNG|nr:hypothetical protein BASA50_009847 [Batrachochytrium salamandrivorans]
MSGLPRQVIKWLQSLDLSFTVRIPKRDFANGYLIAEIFLRYYPNQLQVCLLYTGDSTPQKSSNWDVLHKFFKRNGIHIPRDDIDAVMHCHSNAAVRFVENVYMLLTNTILPENTVVYDDTEIVPHFALPTRSNTIRCMAQTIEKTKVMPDAHNGFIKQMRGKKYTPTLV